ncbi:hypothetical protein GC176_26765 [bacterium]|nr:hypothetical protein [bacterium]
MTLQFAECAARIRSLRTALGELEAASLSLQLEPLARREWFRLLEEKLLPQVGADAFLVAAVVGGTNIGKSVIFNHIAGTRASATSPLASGTKHPVVLVPPGFEASHDLATVFAGFKLVEWTDANRSLDESSEHLLFRKLGESLPPNLLVLDTPDIDSDARINWERADMVRRASDVLIAVLTQQKYNDAAVKEFFRRAAAEDKVVLAVFNQVHLPDDEDYWPLWMETFCNETGVRPHVLYLAPHDRKAAEENRLELVERTWSPGGTGAKSQAASPVASGATSVAVKQNAGRMLGEDLSSLRFGEIKLRTLGRSIRLLCEDDGVPAWLNEIRTRSSEFRKAAELLATHKLAEIEGWPTIPNSVIVGSIREWWQQQREGWSATVHSFYNRIGDGLKSAYRFMQEQIGSTQRPPLDIYREKEWQSVLDVVDDVYSRLNWFRELGNPLLQPRLEALLGATSRESLLKVLRDAHNAVDVESAIRELVSAELESFRRESPEWFRSLRHLDAAAAAARPATSIVLFVTGFGPFGHALGQVATETAITSVVSVAGDVAAGGVTAAVGETWISSTASSGIAWLEAHFRRIHERFAAQRGEWLAGLLETHLLGSLPRDLGEAAMIPDSDAFRSVEQIISELSQLDPEESPAN